MRAPQIVMIVLLSFSVARGILEHGESDGKVNFWVSLLGAAITAALLWWGGFWFVGAK